MKFYFSAKDSLPAQLRDVLGRLEFVLDFELTASSKLAQELPQNVMASLLECGYHLQFPPVDVVSGPAIPPAL